MKKFLLIVALIITSLTSISASEESSESREESRGWGIGGKINIYSGWNGAIGIGVYTRHNLGGSGFRLEPSLVIICEEGSSIDLTTDLQYPFNLSPSLELYPLVGLSLNDPGKLALGVNLGGGLGYRISQKVTADFGMKYMISTLKSYSNPMIFSIGCGFNF